MLLSRHNPRPYKVETNTTMTLEDHTIVAKGKEGGRRFRFWRKKDKRKTVKTLSKSSCRIISEHDEMSGIENQFEPHHMIFHQYAEAPPIKDGGSRELAVSAPMEMSAVIDYQQQLENNTASSNIPNPKHIFGDEVHNERISKENVQSNKSHPEPPSTTALEHFTSASKNMKGILEVAKETITILAKEVNELENGGFFFCVEGCGNLKDHKDITFDCNDDMSYDAEDLRMLNETFMSGLTCEMDDDDSDDFSEDSTIIHERAVKKTDKLVMRKSSLKYDDDGEGRKYVTLM